jgi:hypothetical protein
MNKLLLFIVMLPSRLWQSMGADITQLRAILSIRLTMDNRKPFGIGRRQSQKKVTKHALITGFLISLLMGGMYTMFSFVPDTIFSITIFLGYVLIWLCLMLITDFSTVLFDQRDKFIINPRPVNDKTIVLAKVLHIFIYLFRVVIPIIIPEWIFLAFNKGWLSALIFPFAILLILFMALFLVNTCYLLVVKFAATKFKEYINYFQIAASVVLFTSIYVRPRSFDATGVPSNITEYAWIKYFPTYWLASLWSLLGQPVVLAGTSWYWVWAIILPLLCFWVMIKYLAPNFASNLSRIEGNESSDAPAITKQQKQRASGKTAFYVRLANLLNRNKSAQAGFIITWLQTGRSRQFKMRVYPSYAYVPVYFIFLLSNNNTQSLTESWQHLTDKPKFIILLYMCIFVIMNAMNYVYISDQYKAAWVYWAAPLQKPGQVLEGAFKALWIKYLFPFFFILSLFTVALWGPQTLPDLFLALINVTLFAVCMIRVSVRHFPFSTAESMNQAGQKIIRAFMAMLLPALLGVAHYLLVSQSILGFWLTLILKIIFMTLSFGFMYLVWDSYINTSWKNIKEAAE